MTSIVPQPLVDAITVEMAGVADSLCKLACVLAADMAIVEGHFDALQSIDLLTQIQRALVDLLRGTGSVEDKLARIPVEALAARLTTSVAKFSEAA